MNPTPNTPTTAWVHNLDPFLLQITETFGIRWYGMAYLIGFFAGALLMIFLAQRGRRVIKAEMVTDYITYVVLGTMIGGRLGYVFFYKPDLLTDFSANFPYWGVLRIQEGGMASHGGILGIIVAAAIFAKRHKLDWRHLGDLTVLGGSIGIFLGRIANFINGELFGREAGPGVPWAVKFPTEMHLWLGHDEDKTVLNLSEPDALLKMTEAVKQIGVTAEQWQAWVPQVRFQGPARANILHNIDQVLLEIQNGNEAVRAALGPFLTPRHPSQLYEALLEGLLLFIVAFLFWRKPRKPGVVGGLWLTLYACVRIFGEQFRMPDAHIGFQLLGLTRGQWLSIGMLIVSIALLVWTSRRDVPVIGGWGREARRLRDDEPESGAEPEKPTPTQNKKRAR